MTDSLTALTAKIQALLGDDGTIFTTAMCTAAIRKALSLFNQHAPIHAGELISAVSDQYEYELTDTDSRAVAILDILLQGDNTNELDTSLTYDEYNEDERIFFRLRSPQPTGETLIARYTVHHTVNELDSETESTLPAWQDETLVTGAAAEALQSRAYARVETINLNQDVSKSYKELSAIYKTEFYASLRSISRKRAPVGAPDTRAWNDKYSGWDQ
jgi:hypothetical protein